MSRTVLLTLLLAAGLQAQTGGSVISGVVRNAWSRVPLRRAVVTLTITGADPMDAVTYSDSNGAFAFGGVPAGSYFLCAAYKGYDQACYGQRNEPGQPVPHLLVRGGESRQDIVLSGLPLGSVSGTVLDGDGDPVSNAQIRMLRAVYARRSLRWESANETMSNDRGEYRLSFVEPGKYRLMATRTYQPATRMQPDVTNGQKEKRKYLRRAVLP